MPLIKRAIKKMRLDKKRASHNASIRRGVHDAVKAMRKSPSKKLLTAAFTTLDKAAKTNIIHPNRAARLKSRLSYLLVKSK